MGAGTITEFVGDAPTWPVAGAGPDPDEARPRLARHVVTLGGHRVGVAVCGQGVPLVAVHGFTAESVVYAQALSRLVRMGFKVIAVDTAGHGATEGFAEGGGRLASYADLLGRVLDELGVPAALLAGHSMGGRLVVELAARRPEFALGVVDVDGAVGEPWDRLMLACRVAPPVLAALLGALVVDSASTLPVRDPRQAAALARLYAPSLTRHVLVPRRLLGPGLSLVRSGGSRWMLERLADRGVPFVAVHGDRDLVVPLCTAQSAARLARGQLVVVHGAAHSWLLSDPVAFPELLGELLRGPLAVRVRGWLASYGLGADPVDPAAVEAAVYAPDAPVLALTPPVRPRRAPAPGAPARRRRGGPRRPRYRWTVTRLDKP